jgi:hypothetical protein
VAVALNWSLKPAATDALLALTPMEVSVGVGVPEDPPEQAFTVKTGKPTREESANTGPRHSETVSYQLTRRVILEISRRIHQNRRSGIQVCRRVGKLKRVGQMMQCSGEASFRELEIAVGEEWGYGNRDERKPANTALKEGKPSIR